MADKPTERVSRRHTLELQVLKTLRDHKMLDPGDRVLVAVSGGADSVALLHCLFRLAHTLKVSLTVAHFNHGLRGAESDGDAAHVRELCAGLGLDLVMETAKLRETLPATGANLEEAAREARYGFLKKAARRAGCAKIAVGHNQNDQAETVLLRFLRGSGADGLAAIHPVREAAIIRPLIRSSRPAVERYLESLGVSWRVDSSNRDLKLRRNRLRHELLPTLEKHFNPSVVRTLAREADLAREIAEYLDAVANSELERISVNGGAAIRIQGLLEMHPALHAVVLRQALKRQKGSLRGISSAHLHQIVRLCRQGQSGRAVELPGGMEVKREFGNLVFGSPERNQVNRFRYDLPVPGRCDIPEAGITVTASLSERRDPPEPGRRARLNPDSLPGSLIVRSRLPGDRYGGPEHRKVKKMLIDARITPGAREHLPMVAVEGAVVWIPGFEPARPFRVQTQSGQHVVLEVHPLPERPEGENRAGMET